MRSTSHTIWIATAFSAALCIAVASLFWRSYDCELEFPFSYRDERLRLLLCRGRLQIDNEPQIEFELAQLQLALSMSKANVSDHPVTVFRRGDDPFAQGVPEPLRDGLPDEDRTSSLLQALTRITTPWARASSLAMPSILSVMIILSAILL